MQKTSKPAFAFYIITLVIAVVHAVYNYGLLPEGPIPVHFDASGVPNGIGTRESAMGFYAMAVAITGLIAFVINRTSFKTMNIPNKEYWTGAREQEAREILRRWIFVFLAGTNLLVVVMMEGLFGYSRGNVSATEIFWPAMTCYFIFMTGWIVYFYRQFKPR